MAGSADIFGPLLARPAFRADLLYFIRLAGNYAASIVIECRARANARQKEEFAHWLGLDVGTDRKDVGTDRKKARAAESAKELEKRLWQQFLKRNPHFVSNLDGKPHIKPDIWRALAFRHPWFDVFKKDFPTLLGNMPAAMRDRLSPSLRQDHLLPWDTKAFLHAIENLTNYRHWLEHAGERIEQGERRPPVADERLLEILGLMLLPFLGNHLVGRIRHHGLRAGLKRNRVAAMADAAKAIMDKALATRREASRFMNGLKRRVDHETIRARLIRKYGNAPGDAAVHRIAREEAKKRRDLEDRKAALLELYRRYFDDHSWPRYNLENFLIRFGFIGRQRISELEQKLGLAGQRGDFIHAIEPAFMLAMDMALILHSWLAELEEAGVPIRNRKDMKKIHAGAEAVPAIRNQIAHGGWLWAVEHPNGSGRHLSLAEMLDALLAALDHPAINDRAGRRNALLTRLEGALRPCRWAYVHAVPQPGDDPNRMPAPIRVKRWTAQRRARFADRSRWRVERRAALRRLAAAWLRDLAAAARAAKEKS